MVTEIVEVNCKFHFKNSITAFSGKPEATKNCTFINPFPLKHKDFVALMQYSGPLVLVTGDMSLSEAISLKRAFIYDIEPHKKEFYTTFTEWLQINEYLHLAAYLKNAQALPSTEVMEELCKLHGFLSQNNPFTLVDAYLDDANWELMHQSSRGTTPCTAMTPRPPSRSLARNIFAD